MQASFVPVVTTPEPSDHDEFAKAASPRVLNWNAVVLELV